MNVEQFPVLEPFIDFMESKRKYLDLDKLNWLRELSTDETLLGSFVLASTGTWDEGDVAKLIVENVLNTVEHPGGVNENDSVVVETLSDSISKIDQEYSRNEWINSHRFNPLRRLGFDWERVSKHTFREWGKLLHHNGYDTPADWINSNDEQYSNTFYRMYKDLKGLSQFGRVSAFDCLEIANRAGGLTQLELPPTAAKREYVYDTYPKQGFMLVFCSNEPTVEASENARYLGWRAAKQKLGMNISDIDSLLQETASYIHEQGWDREMVVFDLESCLCMFAKDEGYKTHLNGSNIEDTDGGC